MNVRVYYNPFCRQSMDVLEQLTRDGANVQYVPYSPELGVNVCYLPTMIVTDDGGAEVARWEEPKEIHGKHVAEGWNKLETMRRTKP